MAKWLLYRHNKRGSSYIVTDVFEASLKTLDTKVRLEDNQKVYLTRRDGILRLCETDVNQTNNPAIMQIDWSRVNYHYVDRLFMVWYREVELIHGQLTGKHFVRPADEFFDGRFKLITQNESAL